VLTRHLPLTGVDLRSTLGPLRHGRDPTIRIGATEAFRATRTPVGGATLAIRVRGDGCDLTAWGPGSEWALDNAPDLLGASDDPSHFDPRDDIVRRLHHLTPGLRMTRCRGIVEVLVPNILEQKVTGREAKDSYRKMTLAWSEPAPGPFGLYLPLDPRVLAGLPYYAFHRFGVERKRADTLRRVGAVAGRLETLARASSAQAFDALTSVSGIGPWTAAIVLQVALGDPDAVVLGDYHLPNIVGWVLAGEPRSDDLRMLELLEPYRGQRARAVRLIEGCGRRPPARGPRVRLRDIARI